MGLPDHDEVEAYHSLKDSGQRTDFDTGAIRETAGKARPFFISPLVLRRLAEHMELGGTKYPDPRNWEKGLPLSTFFNGAYRHMLAVQMGETDEDHAIAALWNMHCYIHTAIMIGRGQLPESLDDMPDYTGEFNEPLD